MLCVRTCRGTRLCDGLTRRDWLKIGALGVGGLTLPGLLAHEARGEAAAGKKKAKSAIILFLNGGPSQLDMWDLKPDAPEEIRGTFRPIDTSVSGIRISEHMPRMAKVARHYTLV